MLLNKSVVWLMTELTSCAEAPLGHVLRLHQSGDHAIFRVPQLSPNQILHGVLHAGLPAGLPHVHAPLAEMNLAVCISFPDIVAILTFPVDARN